MALKKGLGKGMAALVGENELEEVKIAEGNNIDINAIIPNRYQPRKTFDESALAELAKSIKEKGVIQPILVSPIGEGKYELVAGERRLRASKLAGLLEIPAIVREFSHEDKLEIALIENIQREDLNSMEVAEAYKELMEKLNLTQEQLSEKIGKSRASVANTLRLLRLPDYIRERIEAKELTEGHARAILSLEDIDSMIDFAKYIIAEGLSVREAEKEAKRYKPREEDVSRETKKEKANPMEDLEEKLIQLLGAKVEISGNIKKGKIQIHYFSREELENIYNRLSQ